MTWTQWRIQRSQWDKVISIKCDQDAEFYSPWQSKTDLILRAKWRPSCSNNARKIGDVLRAKWGPFCFGNTGKLVLDILVKINSSFPQLDLYVGIKAYKWFLKWALCFQYLLELFIVLYADIRIHSFWKKLKQITTNMFSVRKEQLCQLLVYSLAIYIAKENGSK